MCPVKCVPKKGGMAVVPYERHKLVPMRLEIEWNVCMDSQKLNPWTEKVRLLMPFMDQILDILASKGWYCFHYFYPGYNQISISHEDQDKTTFTCRYCTLIFKRMLFGLRTAPTLFERCMMLIFSNTVEDTMRCSRMIFPWLATPLVGF